jgi:hypothetical protein
MGREEQGEENSRTEEPKRKCYRPPRILSREPLEALAADCGAVSGKDSPFVCSSGPVLS